MCDVAARCGAEVVAVEHEWGQPVDVHRVLAAHPSPAIIAAVHAETSTGVRSDIAALGAGKGDALLLTDAVTSIAGIELRADDWGIDVGYAGTQKCLGVAPGLAPFTINDRAFERRVEKPRAGTSTSACSAATSARRRARAGAPTTTPRRWRWSSACTPGWCGSSTRAWTPSGPGTRRRALLQNGLQEMGLELFAAEGYRLPELTTVKVPDGVDSAAVRALPARAARHRDRRRRRPVRRHRLADRSDGPQRAPRRRAAGARRAGGGDQGVSPTQHPLDLFDLDGLVGEEERAIQQTCAT